MSRRSWIITAVVIALIVTGLPAGYLVLRHRREAAERAAQQAAARAFANAWQGGTLSGLTFAGAGQAGQGGQAGATVPGATVAKSVRTIEAGLTGDAKDVPSRVEVTSVGEATGSPRTVTVKLDVAWKLAGDRTWSYPTSVEVVEVGERWLPRFEPAVVHPSLTGNAVLRTRTQPAERGKIIGAGDEVIVSERPVTVVGIEPGRADDVTATATRVGAVVGVDATSLAKRVGAASPQAFVEAITLRRAAFEEVRADLEEIPGVLFQERTLALAPTADFARALLGRVGPATEEIVKDSKGRVAAGDDTGLSGLQRGQDEHLAGKPGLVVEAVPAGGGDGGDGGTQAQELFAEKATPGKDLKISLDRSMQVAAEKALESAATPAALVAVRASTGEVLAVANGGPNASGYNRALLGQYAPGSTFKAVTTLGLLSKGLVSRNAVVACPKTLNVGGKVFKNFEGGALGNVPFHTDFANSCNTAFIGKADELSAADLAKAASSLGYGKKNELGVQAFTGSVPRSGQTVEHAAAMIGQGKVLASPVTVAGASAAIASGTWHAPRLVIGDGGAEGSTGKLPADAVRELRRLMREVVTNGTASGLRTVAGGPVSGKTGTAEYAEGGEVRTNAWFTGFQGDVAFACIVENGETGGKTAVPLVRKFLERIAD